MGEQKRHFFNPDVDEKHTIWLALGSLDKLPEGESSSKQNSIKYRNVYSKREKEEKYEGVSLCKVGLYGSIFRERNSRD